MLTKKIIRDQENPIIKKLVMELNVFLAVVHTKSTYILFEKASTEFVLDSKLSMKAFFHTDEIEIEGKIYKKFDLWFDSPNRRVFKGILLDTKSKGHRQGYYNLWRGFAYKPIQGDCSLVLKHVREIICCGNEEHYKYLLSWCAHIVQRPWEIGIAILLRGSQGVGKGVFVHALGALFGHHYCQLANLNQILGRFNSHLQHAVLVFADEAIWGGYKRELGALKALITEKSQFIEAKGKDGYWIENHKHLIISSNEDYAIHLDADDRRFFALNVSDEKKENISYFQAIQKQLENGGYEAFLYELMHHDISSFDPRIMPFNSSSFDIKLIGASSVDRFVFAALKEGSWDVGLSETNGAFQQQVTIDDFNVVYQRWCNKHSEIAEKGERVGSRLGKIFPSKEKKKSPRSEGSPRKNCYIFSSLEECRKNFETLYKQDQSIWEWS